ncbi:hypothetical protein Rhopal_004618-T1 [Rhodotorula paludigena]|uniref:Receptor-activated Ca2+-permeable cation channel n=1 Tax=Rhodotorula paludigena TaxID=86838 RepID=A0AAV5GGA4_9BASI|nr:hypothetical protein Rhopal_004618-T1 [Rhodotorula paludigena]
MASERTPLLSSPPAVARLTAGDAPTRTEADSRGPRGKRADRYYDEDAQISGCNVFASVHQTFRTIQAYVDVPLSDEQMRSPEIQFAIIQPLEAMLAASNDPSIVYVLLLCRLQFIRERDSFLASSSLNETRAHLCELLAIKLLRHQATVAKGPNQGILAMARALVGGFHAFQGASDEVIERIRQREGYSNRIAAEGAGRTNALELAILGKARVFIKSQATQRVISAIYDGKITYSSSSFIDILGDRWKNKEISLYNVREAPLLDHYRLRVPKYRSLIDSLTFLVLFVSFLLVIVDRHNRHEHLPVSALSAIEIWFFVYSLGYSLDKLASIAEHGWSVYAAGLTNGLDAASVPIYVAAFVLRAHSVFTNDARASDRAYAILSIAATLLFPRLAFATISNNLLILSLRAMLADFFYLMGITVFCFIGFAFALNHLSEGDYSTPRITEWLIFIFFGLDGSGIDESPKFDPILGPILFVSFAALSNTLLTSVLVAILSTTYASIASDAAAEDMFRKAVSCFEGVKADNLPPLNLIALCVMWPLSHFLSPRWFHKVNVFATRTLSLPILLLIALYERQSAAGSVFIDWMGDLRVAITARLPRKWAEKLSLLEGAHWECEAVFEYTPSGDEKSSDEDDFDDESFLGGPDEAEELLVDAPAAQRVSNRASAVVDPARMSAAHQQMRPHSSVGSSASSVIGTPGTSTPSLPVPLSRQASFAAASEASTIRATSKSRPPRYPGLPTHAPDSSTGSSTSSSTARAPSQSFLSDATEAVFSASPPSSPQKRSAPHTRFASPPRAVASSPSSSGVKLRRAHTVHERLPANAGAAQPGKSRRGSTGNHDGSGFDRIEFLSTSAPLRESPLARLYGPAQPGEEDFSAAAGSGTAQPGTRAGAVRRRMSMGPATGGSGGHGRRSSDFGIGAGLGGGTSLRGRAPDEPSTAQLMELVQGLVATVARLEEKLDHERRRNEDDA